MVTARELRDASRHDLREQILHGHPVDPAALEGWAYRGTSLGLPDLAVKATWKTFQKTFWREPSSGRLLGWNVRLEQDGMDAPSRPKRRGGRPVTEWNYEVVPATGIPMPRGFDRGLVIDYGRAANPPGPVRITKDPLVALAPGNADELLGVSYLVIGGRCIETPTYFTLEREHPIDYVPFEQPAPPGRDPLRLTRIEQRWAEALMDAIVGVEHGDGLPPFADTDRGPFWRTFESAPGPLVRAGLRPMVHTLTFLPLASGFRRPFFQLAPRERERFLAAVEKDPRYFVRQSMTTLKTLACFAYFDDPKVRERFDGTAAPGGRP